MKHRAITQRIDFNDLIQAYGARVRVSTDDITKKLDERNFEQIPINAFVYVFCDRDLEDMIDYIVKFSHDETLKMIRRAVGND
jgi:hypothetical protein